MQVLIVSDIHGNLPALQKVFEAERSFDMLVSLGDVVNYGPWGNECVDLLESVKNKIMILGNHETDFINGFYSGENPVVKAFFETCYGHFDRIDIIRQYKTCEFLQDFKLIHTIDNAYVTSESTIELSENVLLGHSHWQFLRRSNGYCLMNPGSVGQNRSNPNIINYALWDTKSIQFEFKYLTYDACVLIGKMREMNFPDICLNYITNKMSRK